MFLEAGILTRRSVRQFEPGKEIPRHDIDDILKIAMYAPSGCNRQPWEFVVVTDDEIKNRIVDIHPHAGFLEEASAAIIVCGDVNKQCDEGFWVVDTSAAVQNLLLACHGRGLGACWCAIYPYADRMKQFQELLGLPENVKPNALVVVGYPVKVPAQPKDRFDSEKVHINKW